MGQTRSEQDRQATDETSSREVGFQVEHPTDRIVSRTTKSALEQAAEYGSHSGAPPDSSSKAPAKKKQMLAGSLANAWGA